MVGGFDGERCLNTVDVYDPATSQWTLLEWTMTQRRSGVSTVSHAGYLYALGGFDGERRLCGGQLSPKALKSRQATYRLSDVVNKNVRHKSILHISHNV